MSGLNPLQIHLINNFKQAVSLIKNSNIVFLEAGVFGSFARNEYKCGNDIDFVLIVKEIPDRKLIADLRCSLDEIDCDLAILLESSFKTPTTVFAKEVYKDYRRVL